MAFTEVNKAPTQAEIGALKRRYRKLEREFEDKKYVFSDHISWEDFETLSVQDFLELKELYIEKKHLYWKIFRMEHPEDTATIAVYDYLNRLDHNEKVDFLTRIGLTTHELIDAIKSNPDFLSEVTA